MVQLLAIRPIVTPPVGQSLETLYGFSRANTIDDLQGILPLVRRLGSQYNLPTQFRHILAHPVTTYVDPVPRFIAIAAAAVGIFPELEATLSHLKTLKNHAWKHAFLKAEIPISRQRCLEYQEAGIILPGHADELAKATLRFQRLQSAGYRSIWGALKAAALSL